VFSYSVVDARTRGSQPNDQCQADRGGDVEHGVRRDVGGQGGHHSDQSASDGSRPAGQVTAADALLVWCVLSQFHGAHSAGRVGVLRGIGRQRRAVSAIR
jgi:hypothetical protein